MGANSAFLLYDITRPNTVDNIPEWTSIVREKAGSIPILLIGAKIDLGRNQRKIPNDHGFQIAEKNRLNDFLEISAKDNVNVDKAFSLLTKLTVERLD